MTTKMKLVWLRINTILGAFVAFIVGRECVLCALGGFLLGYLFFNFIEVFVFMVLGAVMGILRAKPMCKNGKCKSKDYQLWGSSASCSYWICKCGDIYAGKNRFFMFQNENGVLEPYMEYDTVFGKWHLVRHGNINEKTNTI